MSGQLERYISAVCERCERVRMIGELRFKAEHKANMSKARAAIVICPDCKEVERQRRQERER